MTDLNPHMDKVTFASTLRFLRKALPEDSRLGMVSSQESLPISYLAPFDPTAIPDGSIDYVISRTVLEHISPSDIAKLFEALRPKMSSNGLMVHIIDHSDHLEHADKSISKINFLTWSKRKHKIVNFLTKEGENRLRHHEYLSIFAKAGYEILSSTSEVHQPTKIAVASLPLRDEYSSMTPDQLATLTSLYVLAPRWTEPAPEILTVD